MSRRDRHRPISGQRALFNGIPPVAYCRRCGRRLIGEAARNRGMGQRCGAIEAGRLEVRHYCRCGRRLDEGELRARHCNGCGRGFDHERSPGPWERPRQRLFKSKKRRRPANDA